MVRFRSWPGRRGSLVLAVVAPVALCAALVPVRGSVANTNAALLLVLVVVAVAIAGHRVAGLLSAVSAALSFDFFLTRPYEQLQIVTRADVETTVLLLLVAAAVTEIAHWGRREQALAGRQAGYLDGMQAAAETVAGGGTSPSELIDRVNAQMVTALGVAKCRFDYGSGLGYPRMEHDGRVLRDHQVLDVESAGLPTDKETELLVESGGTFGGRFLFTALPGTRPSRSQRLVAIALANLVGAALTTYRAGEHHRS